MSDKAVELKNKGNLAFQNGDYDIAVDYFTQAIEVDPTNHVLYSNRSAAYAQQSKFDEALKDADKCIELNKSFVKGYSRRGAALYGLKRIEDAREAYTEGLKIDPNNAACKEGLDSLPSDMPGVDTAAAEQLMNKFQNAANIVRTHPKLKQYADDPEFMAKVESLQKDPSNLSAALGDPRMLPLMEVLFGFPEGTLTQAAQHAPGGVPPYGAAPPYGGAPTYTPPTSTPSSSTPSSTTTSSTTTSAPKPQPVDTSSPAYQAVAMKDEGNKLYKKKQFEQAILFYTRAHTINPAEPTFLLNTAAAYLELGNRAEAEGKALEKEAESGVAVADTKVPLRSSVITVKRLLREEKVKANEEKRKAKALMKAQKESEAAQGHVVKEAQDGTIAADDDEDEIAADDEKEEETKKEEEEEEPEEVIPEVPEEDDAALHALTTEALVARKKEEQEANYQSALDACKEAMQIAEDNNGTYQVKAKIYLRMCNIETKRVHYDDAMEYLRRSMLEHRTDEALKKEKELKELIKKKAELDYLDPEKGEEARKAGNDEFLKGNFPEAIKLYTESIKRNPKDARVFSNRAACYSKLMNWSSAMDDCDVAIKLDPTFIKPYIRKGNIQTFLKQYNQAMKTFDDALAIDPNNQDALQGRNQLFQRISESQQGDHPDEQQIAEAMKDPEIRAIMNDPLIQGALQDMQTNPERAREHLQNPRVAQAIPKLVAAGILKTR